MVSTPPKSRDDRPDRAHARRTRVVAADAGAAVHAPGEERAVEAQPAELERPARQRLAGGAARVVVLLGDPQLQAGAALAALGVVGGREAGLGDLLDVRVLARSPRRAPPRPPPRRGRARRRGRDASANTAASGPSQALERAQRLDPRPSRARPTRGRAGPRQSISRARPPAVTVPVHAAELLVALQPARRGRARRRSAEARGRGTAPGTSSSKPPSSPRRRPASARAARRSPARDVADGDLAPVGALARRRPPCRRRRPGRRRRTAPRVRSRVPSPSERRCARGRRSRSGCRRRRRSRRRGSRARSAGACVSSSGEVTAAGAGRRVRRRCRRRRSPGGRGLPARRWPRAGDRSRRHAAA